MKTTITTILFAVIFSAASYAQTVHQFYVQDFNNQGYDPFSQITVEVGDIVRFLNGTGGTYNFEIQDQNNQPNFEEPGVPNGQLIYELTIDVNYPNYNEVTVSEYVFSPDFIKTVEINKNTASVEELSYDFTIYPNPVQDAINITSSAPVKAVSILSIDGKVMYEGLSTSNIDVSSFNSGVYIVKCTLENNQVLTKNIIK